MLVYLQNAELLEGVTAGYGGQVVIHDQSTFPFPDNEGVALPAGTEINIGITLVSCLPCVSLLKDLGESKVKVSEKLAKVTQKPTIEFV